MIDEALELAYEAQRVRRTKWRRTTAITSCWRSAGRDDWLFSHAKRYLSLLLQKGSGDEALTLYRAMQAKDADFAPEQPAQLLKLAEAARRRREFPQALAIVKGFDKAPRVTPRFRRSICLPHASCAKTSSRTPVPARSSSRWSRAIRSIR